MRADSVYVNQKVNYWVQNMHINYSKSNCCESVYIIECRCERKKMNIKKKYIEKKKPKRDSGNNNIHEGKKSYSIYIYVRILQLLFECDVNLFLGWFWQMRDHMTESTNRKISYLFLLKCNLNLLFYLSIIVEIYICCWND